jgi:hypothetical protein
MHDRAPRVSIGMPVRNGQRFLRQALDSLLAQTLDDFELIVCDNASSDDTQRICLEYAGRDPRLHYHRNARDIGPAANYNLCVALSRGEYFRWHAHDDLCAASHLQRCVEALDADPSVVIAYPQTTVIDDAQRPVEMYDYHPATDSADPCRRFSELVFVNHRRHRAVEIFGLMRAAALRCTPLQGSYARGDSVLLVRLALLGRFVELPGRLFLSRKHATQSMQTLPSHACRGRSRLTRWLGTGPLPPPEWWDRSLKGKLTFPEWNLFREYWVSIGSAPLDPASRCRCYAMMVLWLVRNAPKLARDVIVAAEHLMSSDVDLSARADDLVARPVVNLSRRVG